MSWNYGFSCTARDFDEKATIAFDTWQEQADDAGAEAHDQARAAISAARTLVDSGAVHHMRGPEGLYDVHISGHANPGHVFREGWAHDVITVTVRQAIPPVHQPNYEPAPGAQSPAAGESAREEREEEREESAYSTLPSPERPVPIAEAKERASEWEERLSSGEEESSGP